MNDKYNQKWVRIFGGFPLPATWAITLGQTTYYSASKSFVDADTKWQKHENKHKEQWKREGRFTFAVKYLWYQMTKGYDNNPYEVEAREVEK